MTELQLGDENVFDFANAGIRKRILSGWLGPEKFVSRDDAYNAANPDYRAALEKLQNKTVEAFLLPEMNAVNGWKRHGPQIHEVFGIREGSVTIQLASVGGWPIFILRNGRKHKGR